MRHSDADRTMATERYLLGEMTNPELDDFEEHMFVCLECAEAVRTGAEFTENARAIFRERRNGNAREMWRHFWRNGFRFRK
jgi:pyocin large subunit-like protein